MWNKSKIVVVDTISSKKAGGACESAAAAIVWEYHTECRPLTTWLMWFPLLILVNMLAMCPLTIFYLSAVSVMNKPYLYLVACWIKKSWLYTHVCVVRHVCTCLIFFNKLLTSSIAVANIFTPFCKTMACNLLRISLRYCEGPASWLRSVATCGVEAVNLSIRGGNSCGAISALNLLLYDSRFFRQNSLEIFFGYCYEIIFVLILLCQSWFNIAKNNI